jgi:spoIIIJ-associated protein
MSPPDVDPQGPGARALAEALEAVARGYGLSARAQVASAEEGGLVGTLEGDDLGALIGKGGATIDAIQYLAAQIVSRSEGQRRRVVVDAAGYRARRAEALTHLAERAASEAVEHGEEIELDAMTPHDRRIVHLALRDRTDVNTRSEGEEPRRRIVVEPAD